MSSPTPPPAEPVAMTPAVPYGPGATGAGGVEPAAGVTLDLTKRSVGATAGKWAIRILLPLLVRALLRAIFRR